MSVVPFMDGVFLVVFTLARQMPDARSFLQPQRRPRPNGRLPDSPQQDVRQDGRKEPEGRSFPVRIGDLESKIIFGQKS